MKRFITILLLGLLIAPTYGKGKQRITERGSSLFYRSWRYPISKDTVAKESTNDPLPSCDTLPKNPAIADSLELDTMAVTTMQEALTEETNRRNKETDTSDSMIVDKSQVSPEYKIVQSNETKESTSNLQANEDVDVCILYFKFDQDNYIAAYEAEIDTLLRFINYHQGKDFIITGHTDERGTIAYNQALSERRAKKLYETLVRQGIDGQRLECEGKGELQLVIPHARNEREHQLNRRVEIHVKSKP